MVVFVDGCLDTSRGMGGEERRTIMKRWSFWIWSILVGVLRLQ